MTRKSGTNICKVIDLSVKSTLRLFRLVIVFMLVQMSCLAVITAINERQMDPIN